MKPAILLLIGALALSAQDAPKNSAIEGIVVNSISGAGIEGAKVELSNRNHKHNYNEVTDAKGIFVVENAAPGDYIPVIHKNGFVFSSANFGGFGTPIHVPVGGDTVRPRFELQPPGTLRGRVLGLDGNPAANVEVALGPYYSATTKTTADGRFVFENVEPGAHSLLAGDEQSRTYYPAAVDPALAEGFQLAPGADQGGYEIRLQAVIVHRGHGALLDAAGNRVTKAQIILRDPTARDLGLSASGLGSMSDGVTSFVLLNRQTGVPPAPVKPAVVKSDGTFEFPRVREGDWFLRVDADPLHQSVPISVRKDVDDINIRLDSPFDVRGRVATSDGTPPSSRAMVFVELEPLNGFPSIGIGGGGMPLQIKNLTPARYHIYAMPLENYYVSSLMVGDTDAMGQLVSLSPASGEIRIVIKPGGVIAGKVENGEGATILLLPQSLAAGEIGKLQTAGADGAFRLAGLAPGDYYAIAVTNLDARSMLNIERLREFVRDAASVHIDEGGSATVQLKPPIEAY